MAISHEPSLDITVKSDAEQWASRLHGETLPTGSVRTLAAGLGDDAAGLCRGQWWVQDAAAALPARLFGDVAGKSIADLCAAPGGKTAQLAQAGAASPRSTVRRRAWRGCATIWPGWRCRRESVVADAAEWQGGRAAASTAYWSTRPAPRPAPSAVTLMWPGCGRRPTSRALTALQKRLLQKAVALLRPGGTLVYCTCSLEPEEGEQAIAALLAAEPGDAPRADRAGEVAGLAEIMTAEGDLRTLPCHLPHADPRLAGSTVSTRRGWLNPDFAP